MKEFKQKNIIIYGAKGWIGTKFVEILNFDYNVIISTIRADNYDAVFSEINKLSPDNVLCCVGRTHGENYTTIDYLELPGKLTINLRDNLEAPVNIANICKQLDIHMTYIGTGCIFDKYNILSTNSRFLSGYLETDYPDFFGSSYSIVKGKTDSILRNYSNVLNCRIRMPIDSTLHKRNFITKILSYDKICSISNSMTVLDEILPIICHMLTNKETGTYNMTNPGNIEHNEILDMYKDIVDKNFKYKNFTIEEQNKILLSKRSNNVLNTSKLEQYCNNNNIKLSNINKAIRNSLFKLKDINYRE